MYRGMRSWLLIAMFGLAGRAMALTTATITVNGAEHSGDSNVITVSFNGYVETVHYGAYSTPASVASTFGAMFSRDYLQSGLCAHAVGNAITFQLRGAATFGAVDITGSTASFTLSPSGFLSSGSSVSDTGTVTLSINGSVIASTDYGAESTQETVAEGLAESASSSQVSVTAIGNTLRIDASTPGAASNNISYSVQNAGFNSSAFSSPSFPASTLSGNLQGGADAGAGNSSTVYQYSANYDPVGNVIASSDSVMGSWGFGYDTLNRLTSGTPATGNNVTGGLNLCWSYDAFGNRTAQSEQSSACPSTETSLTPTASYNGNNQVTFVANVAPAGYGYDGAGDVGNDNVNQYLYDGDGRICAVANTPVPGMTTMTGYIYDADGSRVAKGKITAWSCDPSINGFEPSTEHDYILGSSGEQVTEMAAGANGMVWQHTNVWAGSRLIATYDATGKGLHFYLDDPLGTRRSQTDYAGNWEQGCSSLPYGDALTCSDSANGPTEHQFTSKQYDSESGNYFFEARYYNPGVARFLSPDWSAQAEPVPYAKLDDPQSLNLYGYMLNNPLSGVDTDGHGPCWVCLGAPIIITPQQMFDVSVGALKGFGRIAFSALSMTDSRITNPAYAHMQDMPAALQYSNTTQAVSGTVAPLLLAGFGGSVSVTASIPSIETESATITAEIPEVSTTSLFRAVDPTEAQSISNTGSFLPSPNGTDFKGFFFNASDAESFGSRMNTLTGDQYNVVPASAPTDLVNASPAHSAATEGPGVLIPNPQLPLVKPQQ